MSMLTHEQPRARFVESAETAIGWLNSVPLLIPQMLARFAIAGVFFRSGMTKIANWDLTVQLFQDEYHLPILPPDLAAAMGAGLELSMPVLLVLGLFTRLATLPLLGMTAVIEIVVYPQNWPEHLTWASLLIFLLVRGPGAYSVDHVIARFVRSWRM